MHGTEIFLIKQDELSSGINEIVIPEEKETGRRNASFEWVGLNPMNNLAKLLWCGRRRPIRPIQVEIQRWRLAGE